MKTGWGERVALVTVAVGIVVVAAAGYAFRDRIREEYWLYRLEHGDEEAKATAARRLGDLGCARAAEPLWKQLRTSIVSFVPTVGRTGAPIPFPTVDFDGNAYCVALATLGERAFTVLIEALHEESPAAAALAAHLFRRAYEGPGYRPSVVAYADDSRGPRVETNRGSSPYSGHTVFCALENVGGSRIGASISLEGALAEVRAVLVSLSADQQVGETTRRTAMATLERVDERTRSMSEAARRQRAERLEELREKARLSRMVEANVRSQPR